MLDLVITNSDNFINSLIVHPYNGNCITSDHYLISFSVSQHIVKCKKSIATFTYDFSKGDYHGMNSYLTSCNLSDFYTTTDIEKAWAILKQHISFVIDAFITKVKLHTSQHPNGLILKLGIILNAFVPFVERLRIISLRPTFNG